MNKEEFKVIEGFNGKYEISNLGRIKSWVNDRLYTYLNPSVNKGGYLIVCLRKNGSQSLCLVHRLVALTFIPNPNNYPHIDHINTIKTDNRVENLRWCTPKMNMNNQLTRERIKQNSVIGEISKKRSELLQEKIKRLYDATKTLKENARIIGVDKNTILKYKPKTETKEEKIKRLYDATKTLKENARIIGTTPETIRKYLPDYNNKSDIVEEKIKRLYDPSKSLSANARIIGVTFETIKKYRPNISDIIENTIKRLYDTTKSVEDNAKLIALSFKTIYSNQNKV